MLGKVDWEALVSLSSLGHHSPPTTAILTKATEDTHTPGLVTREPVLLLISRASSLDQVGLWSFRFPSGLPPPPSQASSPTGS